VLRSIEFDYELRLLTNEVGKKWADRKLTTELKSSSSELRKRDHKRRSASV
jgi:hypothetical protein